MYELTRTLWICSARRSAEPGGSTFGHNFRVRVTVRAPQLDGLGRVVDGERLKAIAWDVLAPLDHQVLDEIPPFDEMPPSTENLARHVGEEIARRLADERVRVYRVEIREGEDDSVAWLLD